MMTNLDVNTKRGQKSLEYEQRSVWLFENKYPQMTYAQTPKDSSAAVDAVIVNGRDIVGVVEQKSRNMTYRQLCNWDKEWLVTKSKIDNGRNAALSLGVPFIGFLYLIPDDLLLMQFITTKEGTYVPEIRYEVTATQATINGGLIERENAFISMNGATKVTWND
jgi:hypothetical protein